MSCLKPGEAIEVTRFILPVRLNEAALALEDMIPSLINNADGEGDCRAVAAITDKLESTIFEQSVIPSMPEAGGPIMALEGEDSTEAVLDSWLAKGSVLGADGTHSVFVAFMEVMRRPLQGSWTVQTATVMGTKQSVESLLEELEVESSYAELR
jgi:hypothetical protein